MPLPDLLQWLGATRKTGTLQVERNKVGKSILLRNGDVIGCSSDDPPERLGQWLLARGKITEEQLRQALAIQEHLGKHLGMILVEMEAISADELSSHLEAKAEETIYSLFDWDDAVFRFLEELSDHANIFPVSLRVQDVLLRGLQRYDEMKLIREVFNDPGIVLSRTDKRPPAEVLEKKMARTLYESVNGERSVAELLLHVHGSEYVVTKFLFELHRTGHLEISGVKKIPGRPVDPQAGPDGPPASVSSPRPDAGRPADPIASTPVTTPLADRLPDPTAPAVATVEPTDTRVAPELDLLPDDPLADWEPEIDLPAERDALPAPETLPAAPVAAAPAPRAVESLDKSDAYQLESRLESARRLMSETEFEQALSILDELYNEFPGDESLRRLTAEAEAAFIEKAYRHYLPPAKVPTLIRPVNDLESENLSPTEFFLLSRIDGSWDVKSIIQIAPLREADVLRTLKRLRENGVIGLRDPD
jgi:hypothetical protein